MEQVTNKIVVIYSNHWLWTNWSNKTINKLLYQQEINSKHFSIWHKARCSTILHTKIMVGWCNIPISKTPFFLRISPPDLPRQLMATSSRNFNSVWWPTMLLQVWATTIWTFKLPTTCSLLLLLINNIFSQPPPLIFSISNSSNHRCLTSRMRFFRPIVPMAPLKIRMQQLPIYWPALFVIWTKSSSNTINLYLRIKWYHINKSLSIFLLIGRNLLHHLIGVLGSLVILILLLLILILLVSLVHLILLLILIVIVSTFISILGCLRVVLIPMSIVVDLLMWYHLILR